MVTDKRIKSIELLLLDSRGIYIPRDFVECFDISEWGLTENDVEDLDNPENDYYWDTWDNVLNNARYTKDGYVWRLYQDGDLFAVCNELMTDNEYLEFYGEERE